ncbi:MAG: dienelactone hydrolase family protein [Crocinitomicaceae bacterium]|nr:dienelactone hydrolase family protein [Crocinitomicaceae bacterium]
MTKYTHINKYSKETFSCTMRDGRTAKHDVYTRGNRKKVVVIIQEVPGIGPQTLRLADLFFEQNYTVVIPHLFGPLEKVASARNMIKVCISKEFRVFAKNQTSPIVDFLAELCASLKIKHKVKGVAVIGMCITGNFAISLMANKSVLAGFASQPSLPFLSQKSLHMAPQEIEEIKEKLDLVGPMHCGRFEKDKLCTHRKIIALQKTFNDKNKERIIFHELPGKGHSILTLDFVPKDRQDPTQKTLNTIFNYFDEQLTL